MTALKQVEQDKSLLKLRRVRKYINIILVLIGTMIAVTTYFFVNKIK
jgi:membrane protein YdbS with pleckstrin-like domain